MSHLCWVTLAVCLLCVNKGQNLIYTPTWDPFLVTKHTFGTDDTNQTHTNLKFSN